jgi:hypothetical protein
VDGRVTSRRWNAGARELPRRECHFAAPLRRGSTTLHCETIAPRRKQASDQTSFSLARASSLVSSLLSLFLHSRALSNLMSELLVFSKHPAAIARHGFPGFESPPPALAPRGGCCIADNVSRYLWSLNDLSFYGGW